MRQGCRGRLRRRSRKGVPIGTDGRIQRSLASDFIDESEGGTRLKRRIRLVVVTLLALAFVAVPVNSSKPDDPLVTDIFYDTFLLDALNDLSVQSGVPIIADSTVSGFITMELVDVPLSEALARVVLPHGFTYRWMDGGYYLVGAADVNNPNYWLLTDVAVITPRYLRADVLQSLLSDFYKPFLKVDTENNVLVVTSSPEIIERIRQDVARIDIEVPQVLLEVVVTELSESARQSLGTDWQWNLQTSPETASDLVSFTARTLVTTLDLSYPGAATRQFLLSLRSLVEDGEARVLANPRIVTLNGRSAEIFLGEEQSFVTQVETGTGTSTQRILTKTGVTLQFLPQISPQGEITVRVEPEVSTITGVNRDGYPVVSSRRAATTVRVQDGQTFILGGLLHEFDTHSVSKVPILGDLPILGRLFRSERTDTTETEVVIVVTPTIIRAGE